MAVADAGYKAVELAPPEYWSLVADHGLAISAIAAHQPLTIGLNRRDQHNRLEDEIKASIENVKRLKIPNLICLAAIETGWTTKPELKILLSHCGQSGAQ